MKDYWFVDWMDKRYTEQYDCAAFFVDVQRTQFDRELTLPQDDDSNLTPDFIKKNWPAEWLKTDNPANGDAALMNGVHGYHLGIVAIAAHGQIVILHNSRAAGGVLVSAPHRCLAKVTEYYTWNRH